MIVARLKASVSTPLGESSLSMSAALAADDAHRAPRAAAPRGNESQLRNGRAIARSPNLKFSSKLRLGVDSHPAMNVVVAVAGAKHTLQVSGETSVAEVKAQLESRCGIPVAQQRLLVKGKQAFDDELRLEALGIAEGAKLMLLRNAAGAKAALASASSVASVPLPPSARSAPPATTPSAPTAPPIGHGPISLTVSQGRSVSYCHADTMREINSFLEQPANAAPTQQRFLHKCKEATDELTIQELGLSNGGKLMLLFRQRHHQQEGGRAMIASFDEPLAALRA